MLSIFHICVAATKFPFSKCVHTKDIKKLVYFSGHSEQISPCSVCQLLSCGRHAECVTSSCRSFFWVSALCCWKQGMHVFLYSSKAYQPFWKCTESDWSAFFCVYIRSMSNLSLFILCTADNSVSPRSRLCPFHQLFRLFSGAQVYRM